MDKSQLSPIQQEILKAFESMSEKSKFTEAVLAKKVRETAKIDGKKKAVFALSDIETVISYLQENNMTPYALTVNSANDLLFEKSEAFKELSVDSRRRRQSSEKSMSIFTSSDLNEKHGNSHKTGKRFDRKKLNITDYALD